ncbi:hypothetical protein ASG41_13570 [Modestobacter sp. Leaf380]|nr:hypothetical protein ASG41_13570 [Modestobacter sp. Leaf380]
MLGAGYALGRCAVPADTWAPVGLALVAALHLLAIGSCLVAARREPGERLVWWAVAATFAVNVVGSGWSAALSLQTGRDPFPSVADAWWLAAYPFLVVGILGLYRSRVAAGELTTWLDAATAGLGVTAVGVALYSLAPQHGDRLSDAATAVALAYPIADVVVLGLAVGLVAVAGRRADHVVVLMTSVLLTKSAGDLALATSQSGGPAGAGVLAELCFVLATVLGVVTAEHAGSRPTPVGVVPSTRAALTPLLGTAAGLGVLGTLWGDGRASVAEALALGCLLAALGRSALGVREVDRLREVHRQAHTDELTGLANRRVLVSRLQALLDRGRPLGLLLLDLDGFKAVNDELGHAAGDDVLRHVARVLAERTGTGSTAARLGGDEFAVLVPGGTAAGLVDLVADLEQQVSAPVATAGRVVHVGVSIGVAEAGPDDTGRLPAAVDVLRRADEAMYGRKRRRHGDVVRAPLAPPG